MLECRQHFRVFFFSGNLLEQTVGIPMVTICAPLLADIELYSYKAELLKSALSEKEAASRFNFTYRCVYEVLFINNPDFENCLVQMYPVELEIKDTTEGNTTMACQTLQYWIFLIYIV